MKKFKGFTLIELIVVIAVIGVLAAILVPSMMGWVYKSRITTYNNNASEICTELQITLTDLSTAGGISLGSCTVVYDGSSFSGIPAAAETEVETALTNMNADLTDMTGVQWAARIENDSVAAVSLSGNHCTNVGGFPIQCPREADLCMSSTNIEDYLDCASGDKKWEEFKR